MRNETSVQRIYGLIFSSTTHASLSDEKGPGKLDSNLHFTLRHIVLALVISVVSVVSISDRKRMLVYGRVSCM